MWGYPISVEAVGMIYNKDLVPNPPKTFEEIVSIKLPAGKKAIMWDYNNAYFSMPLLMANGGYVFKKETAPITRPMSGNNGRCGERRQDDRMSLDRLSCDAGRRGLQRYGTPRSTKVRTGNDDLRPVGSDNLKTLGKKLRVAPIPSIDGQPEIFIGVVSQVSTLPARTRIWPKNSLNYLITDEGLASPQQGCVMALLPTRVIPK